MDLSNKQFGRLTAIDSFKKNGMTYWNCICSCQNHTKISVYQGSLLSGATQSCGCYNIEKLKERRNDLSGKVFGRWKVLEYVKNGMYKCQCNCENHTISLVSAQSLKSGNSTCCGCIKHEQKRKRLDSYIGKQFGDFIVDSVVDYECRRVFFNVKCKNGHTRKVREDNLCKLTICKECNKKEFKKKRIPRTVSVGDRFGKLTVLSVYKDNNRTMCRCKCDCGEVIDVYKGVIYQRKSCGKCRKEDLTGMVFGRWHVDSYNSLLGKWKCICSCEANTISYITTGDLKSGHSKSCGCITRELEFGRTTKDLTGMRFGNLKAIEISNNRTYDGRIMWKCKCDCGNEKEVSASNLVWGHTKSCGKCQFGSSMEENNIRNFIKDIVPNLQIEKSKILDGKEIDIYIPELKIGIEYNGSAYHASIGSVYDNKPKYYHRDKFLLAKEKGIHLINIFDVDWKKNKVKSYITDLFVHKNIVYARKCEIKKIDNILACNFVDKYHIQGSNKSLMKINYGLFYNNELMSVMSFGKLRLKKTEEGQYELYRYCVKSGYTIIGGAEKLFKHFVRDYEPKYIRSYSDNDYFLGDIYIRLGFTYNKQVNIRYYWYLNGEELKRDKCQLKYLKVKYPKLYEQSQKESNKEDYIMGKLKAKKVYRSGNTLWVWKGDE